MLRGLNCQLKVCRRSYYSQFFLYRFLSISTFSICTVKHNDSKRSSRHLCKVRGESMEDSNFFSVRIVSIDYYMSPPIPDIDVCYSSFQGGTVNEVPVIRIYGSTPAGQKTCLHIHRALPYLYVPCEDILFQSQQEVDAYTHAISFAIEKALKLKGSAASKRQHVHGCSLLRAKRFYGYHSSEELFVKIYLYYPQDVSRAANLLLGGVVLDKVLQPHESHVPFLLQFKVDYNLSGMGHIHLSKIKFRPPVPNVISSVEASYNGKHNQDMDNFTSPDLQVDSNKDVSLNPPVWISSTIPASWIWPHSSGFRGLSNHHKRLSTCELEGDATIDEILNQQSKMYSSLSQTSSDVKMVQSLIPIWEEEYERTGLNVEEMLPSDPRKPLPLDVLRTFSLGIDFESKLMDLCNEAENSVYSNPLEDVKFMQSIPTIVGNMVEFLTPTDKVSGKNNFEISQDLTCQEDNRATDSEGKYESPKVLPIDETQGYDTVETSDPKPADKEAMGLLRWLISSQAAEDINSDDEAVCETILSPMLPTMTIDKVLEKANLDFESESQQECQDILDSIEFIPDLENRKESGSINDEHYNLRSSSEKMTPQVDSSNPCVGNFSSILVDGDNITPSQHKGFQKEGTSFTNASFDLEETDSLVGSSMRDLMRRKRSYKIEPCDQKIHRVKRLSIEDQQKENTFLFPKVLDFSSLENGESGLKSIELFKPQTESHSLRDPKTSCPHYSVYGKLPLLSSSIKHAAADTFKDKQCDYYEKDDDIIGIRGSDGSGNLSCSCRQAHVEKQDFLLVSLSNQGMESVSNTVMQFENSDVGPQRNASLTSSCCVVPMLANMKNEAVELTAITLCKKSPMPELTDGRFDNALFSPPIPCRSSSVNRHSYEGPSASLGVSAHFQNDGSNYYMLTPACSPPSADSVYRWISHDERGISSTSFGAESMEPSFLKGCSNKLSYVQDPLADACNNPLLNHASGPSEKPISVQLKKQSHGNYNEGMNCGNSEPTPSCQSEGNIAEVKAYSPFSQDMSQISGPDQKSKSKLSQVEFRDPATVSGGQQLTSMSIEILAESRGDLRPDPRYDAINVITLAIEDDNAPFSVIYVLLRSIATCQRNLDGISDCRVLVSSKETQLFDHFVEIIRLFDPDILLGWDIQGGSLGFLAERASFLGIGLLNQISRTPSENTEKKISDDVLPDLGIGESIEDGLIEDEWGRTHASGVHVGGRIVLNIWRLMRGEIKLNMYTFEAVAEAVLRRKIPLIPDKVLKKWFLSGPGQGRYRCIEYVLNKAKLNLEIINQLDLINRTSELARVFGIDFFSVLSRGSQYRVESMLLRLAHTQNYIAISPGNQQVASQPAMECVPLVMEPESGFYADPVIVLDFQSLYPSMIIAYNLCFCTCLGKVSSSKERVLGVTSFSLDPHVLRDLKNHILLTPNGVMYVPSKVRRGILPRLLEEILSTRIMVKRAMKKLSPSQKVLQRIFNARQLALKLIANVTYGYTAAGFSGRMPCAELADSIVQCGRATLETAISFVNAHDKWKAKVIYGDTDSMFVLLKGRTAKEAFQIGQEIASEITSMNPDPVTLKFEKVYHPCFLLTKKRYVGYSYESSDKLEPVFDAKGIETVRRDTCTAVSKTLEQSLRLFFEHQDIFEVKTYLQRQWTRIFSGRISLQDFIFAKEVRLGTYSTRTSSSLPPAAIVATKAMRADPRAEPKYGERIPYIVIHGEPGARLVDMVVDPLDLLAIESPFRLNELYYINKQIIPALQRVFGLVGADLNKWFLEMPRPVREAFGKRQYNAQNSLRTRIDFYYLSKHCLLCGELVQGSAHFCNKCSENETALATAVVGRTSRLERDMQHLSAICRNCGGGDWIIESGVKCVSLACSVFYERRKVQKELQGLSAVATEAGLYPKCTVEWF